MIDTQPELNARQVLHKAMSNSAMLYQQGNVKGALILTQKALLQFPNNESLLKNACVFADKINDLPLAEDYTRQSLAILPNDADLHNNLGLLLYQQDRFEQARQCYQTALKLNPNHAKAHYNLGSLLQQQQHLDQAIQHYQTALKLNPNYVSAHHSLGVILQEQKHFDKAIWHYQTVLKLNPNHVGAYNNLGLLFQGQQHFNQAKQYYQTALKISPNHVGIQRNLSLLLLKLGDFSQGLPGFEYRYPTRQNTHIHIPQYQGQTLVGKSLLIICDTLALGDNIQYIRYLPLFKQNKRVKHLVMACQPELSRLFSSMNCIDQIMNHDALTQTQTQAQIQRLDYWVFTMSLSLHFNTTVKTIPNQLPYLFSPKKQQEQWQDKLPNDSFNIGLVWKTAKHTTSYNRSLASLLILKPLWQLKQKLGKDLNFISLQKGRAEVEAANPPVDQPMIHLGTQIQDFADSAAIVSQLDLVISVDTAIVHLVGSLNIPCWVLLHYDSDWRWLTDREDSPWYPSSVRLFRQNRYGNWRDVIELVVVALDELLDN